MEKKPLAMPSTQRLFFLIPAFCLLLFSVSVCAQPGVDKELSDPPLAAVPTYELPTVEALRQRLDDLSKMSQTPEAERAKEQALLEDAIAQLQQAERFAQTAESYKKLLVQAPEETARLNQTLNELTAQTDNLVVPPASIRELDDTLAHQNALLLEQRGQISELEKQLTALRARPEQAKAELIAAKGKLLQLDSALKAPGETLPATAAAAELVFIVQRHMLNAQIAMLEQELLSQEPRRSLLAASLELLRVQQSVTEKRIQQLQELVNARRRSETVRVVEKAQEAASQAVDKPAVIREAAALNAELSQQLKQLVAAIDGLSTERAMLDERANLLEERFLSIQQQIGIASFSELLGPVLRSERRQLTDTRQYQKAANQLTKRIEEARLQQFQVDEQKRKSALAEEEAKQRLNAQIAADSSAAQKKQSADELAVLFADRRQLLEKLDTGYSSYVSQLATLDQVQRQILQTSSRYAVFLDEKLFWIASGRPADWTWLANLQGALKSFLFEAPWPAVWQALVRNAAAQRAWLVLIFVFLVALLLTGRNMRRRTNAIAASIGNVANDRFWFSIEALLLAVLLVIPAPLLLIVLGWLLASGAEERDFALVPAYGFIGAAFLCAIVMLLRQICRKRGLGEVHFAWSARSCRQLRQNLVWFLALALPCAFLVGGLEWTSEPLWRDTLGRLAFALGSLLFALLLGRVLHPERGVLSDYLREHRRLIWRLRYIWYWLVVAVPVLNSGLALAGYYYTALQLQSRFFISVVLVIGIVVLVFLVLRWLRIEQRRLAWAHARAKREAMLAAREKEPVPASGEGAPNLAAEISALDLQTISEQSRGILRLFSFVLVFASLWVVWDDLLPAFTVLHKVTLWQQTVQSEAGEISEAITLASLLIAIGLVALILFVARNLPGLLEVAVLQRFAVDAGNRYAITTIIRYAITIVGIFVGLNTIGINWDKAQWLIAAMGVGLGFGLQEIVANFISGLIILFERPVRVGDTITLGDVSGTVSRIRIRATTITDWDRKEIVIPNKTFITASFINWTLSDGITRLVIPVGVAYGSDTLLVHKILTEIVEAHPLVLHDPAPAVLLLSLGDSSLIFEIRAFVRELGDRLLLTHELHNQLLKALREHDIEIPFPQRDLHIKSLAKKSPAVGMAQPESTHV